MEAVWSAINECVDSVGDRCGEASIVFLFRRENERISQNVMMATIYTSRTKLKTPSTVFRYTGILTSSRCLHRFRRLFT